VEIEVDVDYLRSLDPKEWKEQDHYAVLGLKNVRWNASDDDVKRAYRKIVLKHHPDKRKANGEEVKEDDDYFTCIIKAYEILSVPSKRRSYDSVDPEFDDTLPTDKEVEKDFYNVLGRQFKLNARWSEKRKVPQLGTEESSRDDVEKFYDFWYNFQSWREYSYLDEEDKEKGQDRDERRWIEKQNKIIRQKRKKEEMARIRSLVDLAYNNDPRIARFKREEKERKLAAKRAKQTAAQAAKAEEERIAKEAEIARQKAEEAEQKRIEAAQREREAQKRAMKKERKLLRDTLKEKEYFSSDDKEKIKHMEGMDKLCEALKLLELQELNKQIAASGRDAFITALDEMELRLEEERRGTQRSTTSSSSSLKAVDKKSMWSAESTQLLVKAVNLFPAGTVSRWEVIANFMNQHANADVKFSAKDVLNKTKDLQSSDLTDLKTKVNQNAFGSFEKNKRDLKHIDKVEISVADAAQTNGNSVAPDEAKKEAKTWTKEEQSLLEQAIKTYPLTTPDRWDRIAECIPGRTKKDCLRRVKELVDRVNAKKEATQIKK